MRLTRFTDIALRALMYLAAHRGRVVPSTELAERLNVSRDHLMKSLQALDGVGLVSATRGRGGGFELTAATDGIRLGELVRSLEPTVALAECFEADSTCPLTRSCRLAGILSEASEAFFDTLDRYTLADVLASDRDHLIELGERRAS